MQHLFEYALNVYPNLYTDGPTATPDYGVGWHYQKSLTYDTIEAQERIETLQGIIELYYPNGEPSSETPDVCCLLDTMIIDVVDEEVIVIGGVAPYEITIDINGNIQVVTVIDFDGCETTAEFPILGLSDELMDGIKIYPNPASTDIHIDLIDSSLQIKTLQLISHNGQLINEYQKSDRILDITSINTGVYILNIELTDGSQMNKRIIILR